LASVRNMNDDQNQKWAHASFRIFGETLQPEEIGVALGLVASRSHVKGQQRSDRNKAAWRESAWLLQSPLVDKNMVDHITWLLDALEPKVDVIKKLSREYRIDFFCGFGSGGQGGFTLDSLTLQRIADFGIPLHLDLYPLPARTDDMESERI
jgi:hypothetical protein